MSLLSYITAAVAGVDPQARSEGDKRMIVEIWTQPNTTTEMRSAFQELACELQLYLPGTTLAVSDVRFKDETANSMQAGLALSKCLVSVARTSQAGKFLVTKLADLLNVEA